WVFKLKRDSKGNIVRYKARLVAKGYSQVKGIDFDETFSPVARYNSIRTILAIAASMNLEIHQMDVNTAFLYGELNEELYMEQPEGYIREDTNHLVCRLKKSIYGLKQAPRSWNKKLHKFLEKMEFEQNPCDWCIYTKKTEEEFIMVLVYVDDILIASKNIASIQHLKTNLCENFSMKDLDEVKHILGIESTELCLEVLKRFNMLDCKPVSTPLDYSSKLVKENSEGECSNFDKYPYREIIGCLMYAMTATRPDICAAVGVLSRYLNNYDQTHWTAAKRVLRYLNGTRNYYLYLGGNSKIEMKCYVDADWAGDINDRKSTTGFVILVGTSLVSWNSRKQSTVALSTTEANYLQLPPLKQFKKFYGFVHFSTGF
ncbi:hypothetical protein B4U79_05827, partial [Dinothrombium tinctorium]